jgi:glucose/arabinose dehydrogenase
MSSSSRALTLLILVPALALFASLAGRPAAAAERGTIAAPSFHLAALPGLAFESPVWVGAAGDGSSVLYVVEQRGIVWKVAGRTKTRFLDIRSSVLASGEQGLLSIAFAQDFRTSGRMFAYFTRRPAGTGQVRQFLVRSGRVVAGSGRDILGVALNPPTATNHNGGNLWAGPRGLLYLSVGDGGSAGDPNGNAQHLGRLTGKLLRIAPRLGGGYVVPRTNPYDTRRGARREIYALGLRNPWRFSIDAPTGDIWIGDVGQGEREEVDRLPAGRPAGANFGWRRFEGTQVYSAGTRLTPGTPYVRPVREYTHAGGGCSITGGVVYRGPATALRGWYLYADYCLDTVTALQPSTGSTTSVAGASGVVHFGAGINGEVYAASQQTGRLYRVVAN